jgi:hypothetical protein
MPFALKRALVISLTEAEPKPDDPVTEFDTQLTTYRGPRTSTLDQLIAFLRKQ